MPMVVAVSTWGYALMNSGEFVAGSKRLDPSWQPRQVVIDENLINDVCGAGYDSQ